AGNPTDLGRSLPATAAAPLSFYVFMVPHSSGFGKEDCFDFAAGFQSKVLVGHVVRTACYPFRRVQRRCGCGRIGIRSWLKICGPLILVGVNVSPAAPTIPLRIWIH